MSALNNKNFKKGQKVTIPTAAHGAQYMGKVFTCNNEYNAEGNNHGWYMLEGNLLFYDMYLEPFTMNREYLEKAIEEKKKEFDGIEVEIVALNNKIAYLDETGQEELQESQFKAYQTLKLLENQNLSMLDRANQIASLFDN